MFWFRVDLGLTFGPVPITFVIVVGPRVGCGAGKIPVPIVAVDGGIKALAEPPEDERNYDGLSKPENPG
jgi:hypothetical protein